MHIAVVGSMNMDMAVTASRLPKKGETILGEALHLSPGGKGANQAVALGKLGARVSMFGCVGQDDFGSKLIDNLTFSGVETKNIRQLPNEKTGVALITVGEQDNTIVVVPGANHHVGRDYIDLVAAELRQADLVMMQMEIPYETICHVIDLCSAARIDVLLNPAPARRLPESVQDKIRYLTPNEHEAALVYGHAGPLAELVQAHPQKLIVTLGSRGAMAADASGKLIEVPARKATVKDTTGAGDTFNAAFAYATCDGQKLEDALHFANTAAALSTEKLGAQAAMPTLKAVEKRLGQG